MYVSLYKGLEGVCGAVLAGDERFVATAQVWRSRLGGAIPDAWPLAVLGLIGLTDLLPRMPVFWQHARDIVAALRDVPGERPGRRHLTDGALREPHS